MSISIIQLKTIDETVYDLVRNTTGKFLVRIYPLFNPEAPKHTGPGVAISSRPFISQADAESYYDTVIEGASN